MVAKQAPRNVNLFGSYLDAESAAQKVQPPASSSAVVADPADDIVKHLNDVGETQVSDMLKALTGNMKAYLDTIEQLKEFGVVVVDKDPAGRTLIKLSGQN